MLDDIVVHDGWEQFNDDLLAEWYSELEREPVIDIHIGRQSKENLKGVKRGFESTSPEVLNTVIDVLGRAVDGERGLRSLKIEYF